MPSKKKRFINKKEAVTFHLVHRSQQDPLQADEEASKHVLVHHKDKADIEKRKEEQRNYGVFYDDDYDYMQHLREANEVYQLEVEPPVGGDIAQPTEDQGPALTLPASVFESQFEKPVGLLNEAVPVRGPQPSWDPDIVEALDDDFDYDNPDNVLDDDFMALANQPAGEGDQDLDDDSDLASVSDIASDEAAMSGSDDFDTDFQYGDHGFMQEETKSRFTEYSMSSSVIRRNQGLTMLDDRFEKLYEEYDDSELGALDHEEIDGSIQQGSQVLNKLLEDFAQQQQSTNLADVVDDKNDDDDDVDIVSEDSESDTEMVKMEVKPEEKWDCESILSTYSNLYNHPKLIVEPRKEKQIQLKGKHGLPEDSIASRGLTQREIDSELVGRERSDKASTYRPKGETTEERSERKKAIKQERRDRRQEKKMNKKAFTAEKVRQDRDIINVNSNLKAVKIV